MELDYPDFKGDFGPVLWWVFGALFLLIGLVLFLRKKGKEKSK